jgi:hypothetical protein
MKQSTSFPLVSVLDRTSMCGMAATGTRYYMASSPLFDVWVQKLIPDTGETIAWEGVLVKVTDVFCPNLKPPFLFKDATRPERNWATDSTYGSLFNEDKYRIPFHKRN